MPSLSGQQSADRITATHGVYAALSSAALAGFYLPVLRQLLPGLVSVFLYRQGLAVPREYGRNRRVADLVQRELAVLLQRQPVDARLGMVTISAVDVSPDLGNARVYVTSLGASASDEEVACILNEHAAGLRHELAKGIVLRGVPKLNFVFDHSIQRGNHLSALIDALNAKDEAS